jgi:hypothetical protein
MGGCTSCKSKPGCDDRKGDMLEAVDDALARLYPSRTWGLPEAAATSASDASVEASALAEELAAELDAAVFVRPGDADESWHGAVPAILAPVLRDTRGRLTP